MKRCSGDQIVQKKEYKRRSEISTNMYKIIPSFRLICTKIRKGTTLIRNYDDGFKVFILKLLTYKKIVNPFGIECIGNRTRICNYITTIETLFV